MNHAIVEKIAQAVLYEGYILYPYRPSVKNCQRWTFGSLLPRAWSQASREVEPWRTQTQCLATGDSDSTIEVSVRFLHLCGRSVGRIDPPIAELPRQGGPAFSPVEVLEIAGRRYRPWQEAVERRVDLAPMLVGQLVESTQRSSFSFDASRTFEPLRGPGGMIVGVLIREQEAIQGEIELSARRVDDRVFELTARVMNLSNVADRAPDDRDQVILRSMASTHTILGIQGGGFVSLIDPPEQFKQAAAACRNQGCFPVLVGEAGQTDTLLSSPIILYDYPQIAPESPGDLFDGTEIDEILSLRILTLTDEEKQEVAEIDDRARALLDRTERMSRQAMMGLHGTFREATTGESFPSIDSATSSANDVPGLHSLAIGGIEVHPGDRVRLKPRGGADAMDLLLAGMAAKITSIEQDYEGRIHVAVVVENDPGLDLGMEGKPGHRFFFRPDEVEPIAQPAAGGMS